MTSIPATVSRLRAAHRRLLGEDARRLLRRYAVPSAALLVVLALAVLAVRGESSATLPVDVRVVATGDPLHLGATTQATVMLTNHGHADVRPRFSLSWLPYPYYWSVVSGPPILAPGQTATYQIEAPQSVAAPHDGERFQIKVNDATSITYAISAPITNGSAVLPIVNPGLRMWTQQDPSTGMFSPAGWNIYKHTDGDDVATITPGTALGVDAAYFHVTQSGRPDPDQWTHTGLVQTVPFANELLDVKVLSRVPYQAITDGWLVTAFGIEISYGKRESIWLLFEPTGSGDKEYDLPNGQHIKVYDVPFGQWATRTIDLPGLYRKLNWAPPRRVNLKLFMGASSFTRANLDGYIAGIGLHESAPATQPGGNTP
ncbi:MAG TPA: hypothetical protein VEZ14_07980 [Dehalococcoidia bacterium]|nr:hypothetical protein [Dehalococcoidia bacterium]